MEVFHSETTIKCFSFGKKTRFFYDVFCELCDMERISLVAKRRLESPAIRKSFYENKIEPHLNFFVI